MPRRTSFLIDEFEQRLDEARDLAALADGTSSFVYTRRLHIYEAAYLLAFSAWESFLEQAFLRFMCGYRNAAGAHTSTGTWQRPRTIAVAYATLLAIGPKPHQFLLWHGPNFVIQRARSCFVNGAHEVVVSSAQHDLEDFAAVRHHVAHRNANTKHKFQQAALRLSGTQVLGGRAGRFLRASTVDPVTLDNVTWLERICFDLHRYAGQIAG